MAEVALRVDSLSKHFGGLRAMKDVSLELGAGERVSVIGTNGAGKSTLFNCIAGALRPSAGRVFLFGEDATRASAPARARAGLARTFQTSLLFNQLTALENVLLALSGNEFRGQWLRPFRANAERRRRGQELLAQVGLVGTDSVLVAELSHGQQRQLEL